jgi:hypothetical protein
LSLVFSEVSITSTDESSPMRPSREPIWKQVPLSNYFAIKRPPTLAPAVTPALSTLPIKSKSVRRALLRYNPPKKVTALHVTLHPSLHMIYLIHGVIH